MPEGLGVRPESPGAPILLACLVGAGLAAAVEGGVGVGSRRQPPSGRATVLHISGLRPEPLSPAFAQQPGPTRLAWAEQDRQSGDAMQKERMLIRLDRLRSFPAGKPLPCLWKQMPVPSGISAKTAEDHSRSPP